jgi:uncharacterized protein
MEQALPGLFGRWRLLAVRRLRMWRFGHVLLAGAMLFGSAAFSAANVQLSGSLDTHDVSFVSHGTRLSGTVVIPNGSPVVAAAVFVQGAGRDRRATFLAEALARHGVAVLVYDKRGVGRSGGVYVGDKPGDVNVSRENLHLLADDAAAAMAALQNEPGLRSVPKGFIGHSQAGWIVPLAALEARGVRFMVLWSGAVETTHENVRFERLAAAPDFWDHHTHAEVKSMMDRTAGSMTFAWADFDPRSALAHLKIPGLWIYGGRDRKVDVDLSIARLKGLIAHGHANDEYRLYPSYDHLLGRFSVDVIAATVEWIRRAIAFAASSARHCSCSRRRIPRLVSDE